MEADPTNSAVIGSSPGKRSERPSTSAMRSHGESGHPIAPAAGLRRAVQEAPKERNLSLPVEWRWARRRTAAIMIRELALPRMEAIASALQGWALAGFRSSSIGVESDNWATRRLFRNT
jgi:hypothetical protein